MTKARVQWQATWDARCAVLAGDIADPNLGVKNEDLFQSMKSFMVVRFVNIAFKFCSRRRTASTTLLHR